MFFGTQDEAIRAKLRLLAEPHDEALRLFSLTGPELGEQLLRRAREVRAGWPGATSDRGTPAGVLLHHIVPEVAARLGVETLLPDVRSEVLSRLTSQEFRLFAASMMGRKPFAELATEPGTEGWMGLQLLSRDVRKGNPLAFAIDRLAAPANDWIAGEVRAAATWGGHTPTAMTTWSPALLQKVRPPTTEEVMAEHVGKAIRSVSIQGGDADDTVMKHVYIIFEDGSALDLSNDEDPQQRTSISCDDDLPFYVGSTFQGAAFRAAAPVRTELPDDSVSDVRFLQVSTSTGSFTVASHVLHNGYYGDFELVAKTVAPRPEPQTGPVLRA